MADLIDGSQRASSAAKAREPMDPVIVLLLAWFFGPVGYFVLGQWQKGVVYAAVWLCALVLAFLTCGFGAIVFPAMTICVVFDAYSQAKCVRAGHPIGAWTFFSRHL